MTRKQSSQPVAVWPRRSFIAKGRALVAIVRRIPPSRFTSL